MAGAISAIAAKQLEARRYADLHEAEMEVKAAEKEHAEWRLRNPAGDWTQNWRESFGAARKRVEGRFPRGGQQMREMLDRVGQDGEIRAAYDFAKADINRGVEAAQANMALAIAQRDPARLRDAVAASQSLTGHRPEVGEAMVADGLRGIAEQEARALDAELELQLTNRNYGGALALLKLPPPEGADAELWATRNRARAAKVELAQAEDEAERLGATDPVALQEALQGPSGRLSRLPPSLVGKWALHAGRRREEAARDELQVAKESVAMLTPSELEKATPDTLGVTWRAGGRWHRQLAAAEIAIRQGKARMNDPAAYTKALAEISKYDPTTDETGIIGVRLRDAIDVAFDSNHRQALIDRLDAIQGNGDSAKSPVDIETDRLVFATAEAGAMRAVEVDGKTLTDEPRKVGQTTEVEEDWIFDNILTYDHYADGQKVPAGEKPKLSPVTRVDHVLKAKRDLEARRIVEQLEREARNPKTAKEWAEDPDRRRMRAAQLMDALDWSPVSRGPDSGLFPTGSGTPQQTP